LKEEYQQKRLQEGRSGAPKKVKTLQRNTSLKGSPSRRLVEQNEKAVWRTQAKDKKKEDLRGGKWGEAQERVPNSWEVRGIFWSRERVYFDWSWTGKKRWVSKNTHEKSVSEKRDLKNSDRGQASDAVEGERGTHQGESERN